MRLRSWIVLRRYKKAQESSEFFNVSIISTLLHNHTIYTTYKLTLMHRHNTPTSVAQPLNFSNRMAWFHKQSAAYWQLCCGWGHYLGRAISIDRPLYKEEWQGWPESCGDPLLGGYVTLVVQIWTSKQGTTEELNDACVSVCACRLVLLSARSQGGVNGLSAISGVQLVYPNEHNSNSTPANCKEGICLLKLLQSW